MENTNSKEHVIFKVGNEKFASPTTQVTQIVKFADVNISEIPNMPPYMLGVLLENGIVLPIISLPRLINMEDEEYASIMIVKIKNYEVGICVKEVLGIEYINMDEIMPMPDIFDEWRQSFIYGAIERDNSLITFIDMDNLLVDKKIEEIKKISESNI